MLLKSQSASIAAVLGYQRGMFHKFVMNQSVIGAAGMLFRLAVRYFNPNPVSVCR